MTNVTGSEIANSGAPETATHKPDVLPFFDAISCTFSYIVKDPESNCCAIVDSVLDFDYASGQIDYRSADRIIECVKKQGLQVTYLIETHVHADHLSAAPYIQNQLGGKIGISEHISVVQNEFGKLFNEGTEFQRDGSQFDVLFKDGQKYQIGSLNCEAIAAPGHTPACMVHLIGNAAFVGDTIFMPDGGTARADFPGGNARTLYASIQKILALPDDTEIFVCHDYQPNGRELEYRTTVAEQRAKNIHVHSGISENDFISMRETRDSELGMPRLIYPSLQTNMRAGHFPPADENDQVYLRVPITGLTRSLLGAASPSNAQPGET